MSWLLLKDSNAIQMLQKLSTLQVKLTELAAKQKYNNLQMKLNMLRTENKQIESGSNDGKKPRGD